MKVVIEMTKQEAALPIDMISSYRRDISAQLPTLAAGAKRVHELVIDAVQHAMPDAIHDTALEVPQ